MIQDILGPDGRSQRILGNPISLSETPYEIRHAAPLLGQDTLQILNELGYSKADYETFAQKGVV